MRQRLRIIFAVLVMVMSSLLTVDAVDEGLIYKDLKFYTAKIYVCDTENKEAVFRDVKPLKTMDGMLGARELEYEAVKINCDNMFEGNGNKLTLDVINGYLLDKEVLILVGTNSYYRKVLYLSI